MKVGAKVKEAGDVAIKKALLKKESPLSSHQDLLDLIRKKLSFSKFIIASNREPYLHYYEGDAIRHIRYASGLTIALDSIASLSQGIWVAHGNGDADMDISDDNGRIMVPPEEPQYILKRIQLSKSEENGYYYGFSNQILWPLCHVAYMRPKFELEYWKYYQRVNQLFAQAVVEETKGEKGGPSSQQCLKGRYTKRCHIQCSHWGDPWYCRPCWSRPNRTCQSYLRCRPYR